MVGERSTYHRLRVGLSLCNILLGLSISLGLLVLLSAREYVFSLLFLLLALAACWVYRTPAGKPYRLLYPALALIISFSLLPLLFTLFMSVTNYASSHMISLNSASQHLLSEKMVMDSVYDYQVLADGDVYHLKLTRGNESYMSSAFALGSSAKQTLALKAGGAALFLPEVDLAEQLLFRDQFGAQPLTLPSGQILTRLGFSHYAVMGLRYQQLHEGLMLANGTMIQDPHTLFDRQTEQFLRPNLAVGYYQAIDTDGQFVGEPVAPGFVQLQGIRQYQAIFSHSSIWLPLVKVLLWTFTFAFISLLGSFLVGLLFAQLTLLQRGLSGFIYRSILLLPWAIPPFISILSFSVLLDPDVGELASLFQLLFDVSLNGFDDINSARLVLILLSVWLGYPYVMLLCLASLKRIPPVYYEAAVLAGYGPVRRFIYVSLPLVLTPLKPVLIALFALNLHNFVLIYLFNQGQPVMADSLPVAGHSQLLLNYVYNVAFSASQNYALASAITSFGLVVLGGVAALGWRWLNREPRRGHHA